MKEIMYEPLINGMTMREYKALEYIEDCRLRRKNRFLKQVCIFLYGLFLVLFVLIMMV